MLNLSHYFIFAQAHGLKLFMCFPFNSCVGLASRLFLPLDSYTTAATKSELCNVTQIDLVSVSPLVSAHKYHAQEKGMKEFSMLTMVDK